MSERDEWGPWVEHDGKARPVRAGVVLFARNALGLEGVLTVEDSGAPEDAFIWASLSPMWWPHRIVAYRIRKPRALLDLIDLVENLPAPSPQPEGVDA